MGLSSVRVSRRSIALKSMTFVDASQFIREKVKFSNFIPARVSHTLQATRLASSTCNHIPLQTIYRRKLNHEDIRWRFKAAQPYDVRGGKRIPVPMRSFDIDSNKIEFKDGCAAVKFFKKDPQTSVRNRPFRSNALVYENGRLLPWIVSASNMVSERSGSFVYFGSFIYFSTTDGSDPRTNGKQYEIRFPQKFDGIKPYANDSLYTVPPRYSPPDANGVAPW